MELVENYRGIDIYRVEKKGRVLYKTSNSNLSTLKGVKDMLDYALDNWETYYTIYSSYSTNLEGIAYSSIHKTEMNQRAYISRSKIELFRHFDLAQPLILKAVVL